MGPTPTSSAPAPRRIATPSTRLPPSSRRSACRQDRGYSAVAQRTYTLAVLPGDGVGPEVVAAALTVLDEVGARFGFAVTRTEHLIGGAAIDATGSALPDGVVDACRATGSRLLGASCN